MHKSILCPLLLIIINEAGVLVRRGQFMPEDRKTSTFAVQGCVSVSSCFFCLTIFCLSMHSIQCNKQFPNIKSITDTTLQYIVRTVPVFSSTYQFHYIVPLLFDSKGSAEGITVRTMAPLRNSDDTTIPAEQFEISPLFLRNEHIFPPSFLRNEHEGAPEESKFAPGEQDNDTLPPVDALWAPLPFAEVEDTPLLPHNIHNRMIQFEILPNEK